MISNPTTAIRNFVLAVSACLSIGLLTPAFGLSSELWAQAAVKSQASAEKLASGWTCVVTKISHPQLKLVGMSIEVESEGEEKLEAFEIHTPPVNPGNFEAQKVNIGQSTYLFALVAGRSEDRSTKTLSAYLSLLPENHDREFFPTGALLNHTLLQRQAYSRDRREPFDQTTFSISAPLLERGPDSELKSLDALIEIQCR